MGTNMGLEKAETNLQDVVKAFNCIVCCINTLCAGAKPPLVLPIEYKHE